MGGVVDAVGGLFGAGGDVPGQARFNPYSVDSAIGQARFSNGSASAQLSPELQGIFSGLLGQAQPSIPSAASLIGQTGALQESAQDILNRAPQFQEQAQGLLGRAQSQFDIARDPQAAIDFQRRAYGPELERQRLSQESRLYNQGLLGSTTGALQQEATRTAQNRALLQGAQQQQQQAFQQGQGLLGRAIGFEQLGLGALGQGAQQELARQQFEAELQDQARRQQLQSLQSALGLGQQPLGLSELGANLGQADLQTQQINLGLQGQAEQRQSDFFGSLAGAGATVAAFSDIRLKKNIVSIGQGLYAWEWNEEAKKIGADIFPSIGVIAQEIQKSLPDAVFKGESGYLMVDYSKVI